MKNNKDKEPNSISKHVYNLTVFTLISSITGFGFYFICFLLGMPVFTAMFMALMMSALIGMYLAVNYIGSLEDD